MSFCIPFCPEHAWPVEPDVGGVSRCGKGQHVICFCPGQSSAQRDIKGTQYVPLCVPFCPEHALHVEPDVGGVRRCGKGVHVICFCPGQISAQRDIKGTRYVPLCPFLP